MCYSCTTLITMVTFVNRYASVPVPGHHRNCPPHCSSGVLAPSALIYNMLGSQHPYTTPTGIEDPDGHLPLGRFFLSSSNFGWFLHIVSEV